VSGGQISWQAEDAISGSLLMAACAEWELAACHQRALLVEHIEGPRATGFAHGIARARARLRAKFSEQRAVGEDGIGHQTEVGVAALRTYMDFD